MMIEMDPSTLPTAKRRSERNAFSRFLNGAGGDRKIYIVAISFGVLLCVIFVLSSGSSKSHGSMGGSINFKTPENHRQVQVRPTNVSLVIVGDSIARYSYLSLVYFLRWGRWFDPGLDRSNLVNEQSFDNPFHEETFHEFYYQTNLMLQPFELCDCHKGAKHPGMRKYTFENRYYHDPEHNNTVTYIHAFGEELPTHGRLNATEVYTEKWKWSTKEKGLMDPTWSKPVWSHASWNEFITKYVGKIKPKPEFAVFQGGQFGYSFDPEVETSVDWLLFAQTQIGMKSFWKTAHYNRTHMLSEKEQKLDTFMCKKLGCLDISWTQNVADKLYWDSQHFFEPVYRVMNEEMLEKLGYLPEKYEGYNKYNLLD